MEAQKIILSNGKTASLASTHTLTPTGDQSAKQIPVAANKAIVFFIGGAGDKDSYYFSGPYNNIESAQKYFDLKLAADLLKSKTYESFYHGYDEVKGDGDIQKNVLTAIPNKNCPIYIIGHSLGGWNGAHLSKILYDKGYRVTLLITLDPVGEGAFVWLGSNIYMNKPEPKSEYWINIRAKPKNRNSSDGVADFGEQWEVTSGPQANYVIDTNHANAETMFTTPLLNGVSAAKHLYLSIKQHTGK